jgi:hypothetical protein
MGKMPMNFIGKVLFPHHTDWERKRNMKITVWVVLVAVLFGIIVGAVMLFVGSKHPN